MQRPAHCYGVLNGGLPWQLQQVFKITLIYYNGAVVEYWLTLTLPTIPEDLGTFNHFLKFVPVRKLREPLLLQDFCMGNIFRCTHRIPEIARSSNTGHGRNKR